MGILISTAGWGPDLRYAFQNNQGSSFWAPTRGLAIHFHNQLKRCLSMLHEDVHVSRGTLGHIRGIFGYIWVYFDKTSHIQSGEHFSCSLQVRGDPGQIETYTQMNTFLPFSLPLLKKCC